MAKLPYIFIFDIDNCIIGDVTSIIDEYTILGYIRKNCKKIKCPDYNYLPPYVNIKDSIKKKYNLDEKNFNSNEKYQ
jgi:hypothetical protein